MPSFKEYDWHGDMTGMQEKHLDCAYISDILKIN